MLTSMLTSVFMLLRAVGNPGPPASYRREGNIVYIGGTPELSAGQITLLTLLYVGEIMLFALGSLMVWWFTCKGKRRANHRAPVGKGSFSGNFGPTTLCGCCDMGYGTIMETICCSECVFAENVEKSLPPSKRFGLFGQIVCQWMAIACCPWYCLLSHVGLRRQYSQLPPEASSKEPESCCLCHGIHIEGLKAFFCFCCSSMQIAEFIDLYGETFGKPEYRVAPDGYAYTYEEFWNFYGKEAQKYWDGAEQFGKNEDEASSLLDGKV